MISPSALCCAILLLAVSAGMTQDVSAVDDDDRVVLRNERLTIALGKADNGAIVSLVDAATGVEFAAQTESPWLFLLAVSGADGSGDDKRYVSSADAASVKVDVRNLDDAATARISYESIGRDGLDCDCTARVTADDPLLRWRIDVTVPDALVLEEVVMPGVALRAPLRDGREDNAVLGHTKGGVFHAPSVWKPGTRTSAAQPGSMAAQFACHYDDGVGLYTAAEDSRGYPKRVSLSRTDDGLQLDWGEYCFQSRTYSRQYDVVMTTFSAPEGATDWRHAADLYKAWAARQHWCAQTYAERDDIPAWLKQGAPFVRFGRNWLARPDSIQRWLTEYWKRQFPADIPLIIAYWGWEKVATWVTPDYFPVFPSDEQFRDLADMNREIGGHVFLWPSGYHYTLTYNERDDGTFEWDDRERFDRIARPHAVHSRDGKLYTMRGSWLRGGANACMCPGDPWTIDWLNDIAEKLVDRGAQIIQVDQVVGGRFPACYSPAHDHPPGPGTWQTQVFRKQLETMLQRCRQIDPNALVCYEEPNEHFIQCAAVQDYRDCGLRYRRPQPRLASVFNYLYHEYIPTFQSNPRRNDRFMMAYCLVNGQMPHFIPTEAIGPGPLLVNGGFEDWAGDEPRGWQRVRGWQGAVWRGKCYPDTEIVQAGDASMRLENTAADDIVQVSQNIHVSASYRIGATYRLSAWVRTDELQNENGINLANLTDDLDATGQGARIAIPAGHSDWFRGEATFTVPHGTDFLRIMCHINGPGKVWIDDITLERVREDGTTTEVMRPETPPDHDIMSQWVRLYSSEARPYLLLGRMLHPPQLDCGTTEYRGATYPAILHNAYRAPDGSEAVVIMNATDRSQAGTLTWKRRQMSVELGPWEATLIR